MPKVLIGDWTLNISDGRLDFSYTECLKNAEFTDEVDLSQETGRVLFLSAGREHLGRSWPEFALTCMYEDADQAFSPGVAVVPETSLVFVGAGTTLLCYDIAARRKVFEDYTEVGFYAWSRHKNYILMAAELEFGVWNTAGEKLWSTQTEPPWDFEVRDGFVHLDVMGEKRKLSLRNGTGHKNVWSRLLGMFKTRCVML